MNDAYARETSKLVCLHIENSFCSCTHIFLNTFGLHFTKCSYLNNYQHLKFGSKYKMFTIWWTFVLSTNHKQGISKNGKCLVITSMFVWPVSVHNSFSKIPSILLEQQESQIQLDLTSLACSLFPHEQHMLHNSLGP